MLQVTANGDLALKGKQALARGGGRCVFDVPGRPDLLIKVSYRKSTKYDSVAWRRALAWCLPMLPFRGLLREYRAYIELKLMEAKMKRRPPVAEMLGFANTDMGFGLLCEAARNEDGTLASTLEDLLEADAEGEDTMRLLNNFVSEMFAWHVRASDIHWRNIVYMADKSGARLVLVDGLGERTFFPLRTMSRKVNELSLMRDFAALKVHPAYVWDAEARQYIKQRQLLAPDAQ